MEKSASLHRFAIAQIPLHELKVGVGHIGDKQEAIGL